MATYQFSALADGQAISFNPGADVLNFDQSSIAAADIRVTASGSNVRIDVVAGSFAGKDVTLLNVTPLQLATTNVRFADGSQLLVGDNSTALNDNAGNRLVGTGGRDLFLGLGGNDTFVGGSGGADVVDGGADFDTIDFSSVAAGAIVVDFRTGTISGGGTGSISFTNIERILATNLNDSLTGAGGGQNLSGLAGADTLWGGAGVDTLWGGTGADTFIFRETGSANADSVRDFASGSDKILLDPSVMTALGAAGNFAAGDARFWGSTSGTAHDADDRVVYNTSTGQLWYDADGSGAGAAQLIATLQNSLALTATDIAVEGGGGGQVINGTSGNDSLTGTAGNDTINGLAGNDTLSGLGGNDVLNGGDGGDRLDGGAGDDTLNGGAWDPSGVEGADVFIGGDGNDFLNGQSSSFGSTDPHAETMDGGLGNDRYWVDNPGDVLSDAGGIDTVVAENTSWTLAAGFENLVLNNGEMESAVLGIGNALNNVLDGRSTQVMTTGGDGWHVHLQGLAGNDTLLGSVQEDTLNGGAGNDSLTGGSDSDQFVFDQTPGAANADVITDFTSAEDVIRLDAMVMTALGASGQFAAGDARFFSGAGANAGHDADDRVVYNTTTGQLWYDADGSGAGAAQLIGTLQAGATLAATDISVINGSSGTTINGTAGDDSLVGTAADETINGLAGNDTLVGGEGADRLVGSDGNDVLNAWAGSVVSGDAAADTLDGGLGDDVYYVQDDGDVILADPGGMDEVHVLNASWTLGAGLENLYLDDSIGSSGTGIGNELDNIIRSASEGGELYGMGGNDRLILSLAQNSGSLFGGDGNDTLSGGGNRSALSGGAGDDVLYSGGSLGDILDGGTGADTFVLSYVAQDGWSVSIEDFASGTDTVLIDGREFSGIGPSGDFGAGDPRFWSSASGTAHDADDRVIYNSATGELWFDADGTGAGAAQLIAALQGAPAIIGSDIAVINGSSAGLNIVGTSGNDTLVGTAGNDTINGLDGNDSIDGLEGADSLIGGAGNDTLDSGRDSSSGDGAADTLDGGLGDDAYHVSDDGDIILADPGGIDTVFARNSSWTLGAGFENLDLVDTVGTSLDATGNELNNVIRGASEGGTLLGLGGNDTLITRIAQNSGSARGGDGNDTLYGSWHTSLFGDAGNDVLVAGFESNMLNGGAGNDQFVFLDAGTDAAVADFASGVDKIRLDATSMSTLGSSGNFSAGDARFYAAAGASSGHDADDRVIYNTTTGQLWYDPDGSGASATERLIATLQAGATLVATDIIVDNGTTGGQTINGTTGADSLVGGAGNDTINGFAGADTLVGNAGDDILDGGTEIDRLDGGTGNDTYVVTAGDVLIDSGGIDTVQTAITWTLGIGFENLTMTGTAGISMQGNNADNFVVGNSGNNYFNARAGTDTIQAGGGNDTIDMSSGGTGSHGNDVIDGGAAFDTIDFDGYATTGITANFTTGTISGGDAAGSTVSFANIERIVGGAFADQMTGNAAGQSLDGRGGNDTLWGAGGVDTLWGGTGADSFVFREMGTANADRIGDFVSGADKISLDDSAFTNVGALGNFAAGDGRFYAAAGATGGHDANDRVIYNTSTGSLYYDADGSGAGAAQLIATLTGNPAIAATDIAVI